MVVPPLYMRVVVQEGVLLREQEQETAQGVDLPFEAIERTEGGEVVALREIVGDGREGSDELDIYCLGAFENPPAEIVIGCERWLSSHRASGWVEG
jgi:hypothetical protein